MKKTRYFLLLCTVLTALLNTHLVFAKTPKQMSDNVLALTEAAALLNICLESDEYDRMTTETALNLYGLQIRFDALVTKIADHYEDNFLYMAYGTTVFKMSSDPDLKQYSKKRYNYCNANLHREIEPYLLKNEKLIDTYLSKVKTIPHKTNWTMSAKTAYIDRCTLSMRSQGLLRNHARPFCTCIADGMEREFGMEEYAQMMKAKPNPSGSLYDQRLNKVFKNCKLK